MTEKDNKEQYEQLDTDNKNEEKKKTKKEVV